MNNAKMADRNRQDSFHFLAQALDNRNAPAPPATLLPRRVRVARGSYAGTFPCLRGLAVLRLTRKTLISFTTLGTECAAVRESHSSLSVSGGTRMRFDRIVTARQWASQKTAWPIEHSIHEASLRSANGPRASPE